ncbi:MAG: acyl carrier protein [Pararhizobium sp.]
MIQEIRDLLAASTILPCDVATLADEASLYDAGLTSFGSVQMMLAIEERFDVEFPEEMLTRRTFGSIGSIAAAVATLTAQAAA